MACPPNYVWQSWLEAQFPAYRDKLSHEGKEKLVDDAVAGKTSGADTNGSLESRATKVETEKDEATRSSSTPTTTARKSSQQLNIRNTGTKFALDQTFGAAVNTVLFIAGIALLRGHDIRYVTAAVQADFWPLIFAGQRLWYVGADPDYCIAMTMLTLERIQASREHPQLHSHPVRIQSALW